MRSPSGQEPNYSCPPIAPRVAGALDTRNRGRALNSDSIHLAVTLCGSVRAAGRVARWPPLAAAAALRRPASPLGGSRLAGSPVCLDPALRRGAPADAGQRGRRHSRVGGTAILGVQRTHASPLRLPKHKDWGEWTLVREVGGCVWARSN